MKKLVASIIAAAFALSLAGAAVAEEKKPAAAPAAKEAPAKAPKAAKPRVITGMVEAVDTAAGTVTVKGRKEAVTLKAAEGVKLDEIKAGDKVTVTFRGETASKVVKAKAGKGAGCKDCPKAAKADKPAGCMNCPKADAAAPKADAASKK
jgi:hypothetical protein